MAKTATNQNTESPNISTSAVDLSIWRPVAELIARVAGPTCEVVLHDLSDPVHSVVHVVNGHVTRRAVGQGFRHLVVEMLRNEAQNKERDLLEPWWFHHGGKLIRSMTLLIRGESGELIGALCVNQDVTQASQTFDALKTLLPGLSRVQIDASAAGAEGVGPAPQDSGAMTPNQTQATTVPNTPRESVLQTVFRLIDGIAREARPNGEVLTRSQRLNVLSYMDEREVFLVKGSIERAAQCLGISKVTVYSDLDALHRQENGKSNNK